MNKEVFKQWIRRYEHLEQKKKNIFLIVVFFMLVLIMAEYLLFKPMDVYKELSVREQEVAEKNKKLVAERQVILQKNAENSQKNLMKQKMELSKEIEKLLPQNKSISYVSAQNMPELIDNLVTQVGSLKVLQLKNLPEATDPNDVSGLIKHSFSMNVEGSYQAIYDFMKKLNEKEMVNVSLVKIEKKPNALNAQIDFYLINTNKHLMSFN